jgi:hypothetical protein
MSKCFLVATHLRYPQLKLLDLDCQVGDGASEAFTYLYRPRSKKTLKANALDALALAENAKENAKENKVDVFTIDPSLPKAKQEQLYRQGLLFRLHTYLVENMNRIEPILAPMIKVSGRGGLPV